MTVKRREILICRSTGCNSMNAQAVHDEFEKQIKDRKLKLVELKRTGCRGFCEAGPSVLIQPDEVLYVHLTPKDVVEIVEKHLINDEVVQHLVYMNPETEGFVPKMDDIQFFHKQRYRSSCTKHSSGKRLELVRVPWKGMDLPVFIQLKVVFNLPEEDIVYGKLPCRFRWYEPVLLQDR